MARLADCLGAAVRELIDRWTPVIDFLNVLT
jgi:hypothetical protein